VVAEPRPAASVLLVRRDRHPIEVYMIRRDPRLRFLGGYYAFPGGKVDAADAAPGALARCRGVDPAGAARVLSPGATGHLPPLAFWVAAARELLEETGILAAGDEGGRPLDPHDPAVAARIAAARRTLAEGTAPLETVLAREGWWLDLGGFRYLSHFITPPTSPIRFTARFFLAPLPAGQSPRLDGGEASEGLWIAPRAGVEGYESGRMPMAEPAEAGLRYLAEFPDLDALWAAHGDGRHKFHGIADRVVAAGFAMPRGRRAAGA
jgi:8-oxo-dGTP pyrophosphatase MutT (NUDIX family)